MTILYDKEGQQHLVQDLLDSGFIKVGSKSYCEYWMQEGYIITLYPQPVLLDVKGKVILVGASVNLLEYGERSDDTGVVIGTDFMESKVIVKHEYWSLGLQTCYLDVYHNELEVIGE